MFPILANSVSMTSRDIADLVESNHSDVKRSIERLVEKGVIESPPSAQISTSTKPTTVYVFDHAHKRDSIVVVAQLSPEFTARLVDRWQELEAAVAGPPLTGAALLVQQAQMLLAMEQEQARQSQQLAEVSGRLDQIETAGDHFTVIGYHRYVGQAGSLPLATAAAMGKQATRYCEGYDIAMGQTPDPRFGRVNTYPKWVLDKLFGDGNAKFD